MKISELLLLEAQNNERTAKMGPELRDSFRPPFSVSKSNGPLAWVHDEAGRTVCEVSNHNVAEFLCKMLNDKFKS